MSSSSSRGSAALLLTPLPCVKNVGCDGKYHKSGLVLNKAVSSAPIIHNRAAKKAMPVSEDNNQSTMQFNHYLGRNIPPMLQPYGYFAATAVTCLI